MKTLIEHSLKDSELRYRRLFEAAQDGILILDAETGMITDVNPYLIKMLGYSRQEFVEKRLWEVGAFKDIEASQEAFEALQKNKYIRYADLPLKAKDERLIRVEFVSNVYQVGAEKVIQCNIRDITARKRAEDDLSENEERYHLLFENNPLPMWVYDLKTLAFLIVNDSAVAKYGYTREEFLHMTIADIRPIEDVSRLMDHVSRQRPNFQHTDGWRHRLKDGTIIDVEVTSHSLRMGEHDAAFVVAHNITERKRAEQEIASLAKFPSENPNPVLRLSRDGIVIYANAASGALLGLWGCAVGDPAPQGWRDLAAQALACRENKTVDIECDGKVFSMVVTPVAAPGYVNLYGRDITERKRAEDKLELANSQLTNLYNNLPEALFSVDMVQNKMLQVSPAHEAVFGYACEEFFKTPQLWYEIIVPEDKPIVDAGYPLLSAGKVLKHQFRIRRPDGKTRWIEAIIKPNLAENGQLVRIDGIASDITERKHSEERIQRQLEHLIALSGIDRVIASNFDLKLSLSEILNHVTIELGIDAAAIFILNPISKMLECGAEHGFRTQSVRKTQIRLGESYAGRAALERQLVQIPNISADPDNLLFTTLLAGEDFVCYYGVPLITRGQVKGVLEVFNRTPFEPDPEWLDFLNTLAGQTAIAIENATLFESLERSNLELTLAYDATIEGWSRALDLRDHETEGHTQRVTEMTVKLGRAFGLSEAELVQVRWGTMLHDIGKMGVPDGILLKPGPLTAEEWVVMKKHPTFAHEMLAPIRYLRLALDIPYGHHEKWDGSGYPNGLNGAQIPLVARIFAVVDVWDALSSDRPYRAAWSTEKVRQYILTSSGTHFDPQVVDVFMQLLNKN